MFLILFTLLICIVLFYYFRQVSKYKIIDDYPGPTPLELIKFMLLPKSTSDSYKFFVSLTKRYGPVVKLWIKPFKPSLLVSDGKFIKNILLSKEHVNKPNSFCMLDAFVGSGLPLMRDATLWRQERKTFSHIFNNQFITDYIVTFKTHASKLCEAINKNLNQPMDLQVLLLRHGLNIIYDLLLHEDISEQDERVYRYVKSLKTFFEVYSDRVNSPLKMNDYLFKLTDNYKTWNKCSEEAKEFIDHTLAKVVKSKKNSPNKNDRKDLVDLLLESNMSYDRILENFRTFAVAGSDTVVTTIGYALYELAKKPELQEKIYQEYISILGTDDKAGAEFRDIQQMTFTECVMRETLRIYPPVPFIMRSLLNSTEIGGKVVPGGVDIIFSIMHSHNSNFDDPAEFKPERFLPENAANIPANAFLPFSLGPRDCIGKIVAIAEVKFLLSYIIRRFTVHPINDHQVDLCGEVVLTSKTGLPVIFKKRDTFVK